MTSTPDLVGQLTMALERARRELSTLNDLAEQVQSSAATVVGYFDTGALPPAEKQTRLQDELDHLLSWQMSETRTKAIGERARVLAGARP